MNNKREDTLDRLNDTIKRLIEENSHYRKRLEEAQALIRREAPNAAELTLVGSIKVILKDRNKSRNRIGIFRDELKKVLRILAEKSGSTKDVIHELNQFLFKNHL